MEFGLIQVFLWKNCQHYVALMLKHLSEQKLGACQFT